ncbi:hypothetical protein JIG36_04680 [Actinoplanes sp. LDG1-06]|uniref:Uncharacterized protein n=1 Tax=Paractinoplanes ovalisporus TaxID=2810368 RepID=A0ABS2A4X1_9ACTN|nr:DUF6282 family protein [Actinoplanes ovalisporus]MBM2614852.1 hypothetical protein [Actinoplanes ovalisporus]
MSDAFLAALPEGFGSLLHGAIDVHVHGQPDVSAALPNRGSDVDVARLAHAYGMSGWVLKSHLWPTTDRARAVTQALAGIHRPATTIEPSAAAGAQSPAATTGFRVFGSITLNPPVGGLEPAVVEMAAAHGARVVFLPTWGSAADMARDGYITRLLRRSAPSFDEYAARQAVALCDPSGRLSLRAREVADACRALGLALATGHASPAESRAVAAYGAEIGLRVLVTHPLHYTTDPAELREFADMGALLEFCNAPLLHPEGHLRVRDVHDALTAVGADNAVLTTDVFSRWVPPEPECLRMFVEQLAHLGWTAEQIRTMVATNPLTFLGEPA